MNTGWRRRSLNIFRAFLTSHQTHLIHNSIIQAVEVRMKRSYAFSSRKAGQLTIFTGLGLIFLLQNIFSLRYFLIDTMTSVNFTRARQEMKVCICLADDRYTDTDMQINSIHSIQELRQYARNLSNNSSELSYWRKTALINSAYAMKSGYDIILSDLSPYRKVFTEPRPSVWLKPSFMLDLQYKRPDCDWFALIDSDAYFWMSNQTLSLSQWFSTSSLHEASPVYYEFEAEKRDRQGFYNWDEQKAFFLVGLNGMFSSPAEGFPNVYEDRDNDFICAGVYFIKNGVRSKQFLHDWVSGPVDSSDEEMAIMQEYALKFSLEQRVLNMVLYPRYKDGIHIYSYRDFGSKNSPMIRHIWSAFHRERSRLMDKDLATLGF